MLGTNLRVLVKRAGITQNYISDLLGVSRNTVSTWLNGHYAPRSSLLVSLCNLFNSRIPGLNLTPDCLLNEDLTVAPIEKPPLVYEIENGLTAGLLEFIADEKIMSLMDVTPEEVEALKGIRFIGHWRPSKDFYVDALFEYRKAKKENHVHPQTPHVTLR